MVRLMCAAFTRNAQSGVSNLGEFQHFSTDQLAEDKVARREDHHDRLVARRDRNEFVRVNRCIAADIDDVENVRKRGVDVLVGDALSHRTNERSRRGVWIDLNVMTRQRFLQADFKNLAAERNGGDEAVRRASKRLPRLAREVIDAAQSFDSTPRFVR